MQRIALALRYDGTNYHGWQIQDTLRTIQSTVEHALSAVADDAVAVTCAGRTDAGVHAEGQVIHFDTRASRSERAWVFGANSNLPHDISVLWAKQVDSTFHARFSATARRYRYILYNHEIRPGILRKAVGWYYRALNEKWMQAAAQNLLGEHDFSSFRGAGCQANHAVRTIHQIEISRIRHMIIIDVHANAFLLHMVRNIVGALIAVGCGEKSVTWIKELLMARDRKQGGVTIAPQGLYLVEVNYPPQFKLPQAPVGPFFLP
jgi:tRNA pseudouridine38-40 synthase